MLPKYISIYHLERVLNCAMLFCCLLAATRHKQHFLRQYESYVPCSNVPEIVMARAAINCVAV